MASGVIHVDREDVPTADITNSPQGPRYAWITLRLGPDVCVYFPCGPSCVGLARTVAADLLRAADAFEALEPKPSEAETVSS